MFNLFYGPYSIISIYLFTRVLTLSSINTCHFQLALFLTDVDPDPPFLITACGGGLLLGITHWKILQALHAILIYIYYLVNFRCSIIYVFVFNSNVSCRTFVFICLFQRINIEYAMANQAAIFRARSLVRRSEPAAIASHVCNSIPDLFEPLRGRGSEAITLECLVPSECTLFQRLGNVLADALANPEQP